MASSIAEKKRFRQIGHLLNPIVLLGNQGLTEAVLAACSTVNLAQNTSYG